MIEIEDKVKVGMYNLIWSIMHRTERLERKLFWFQWCLFALMCSHALLGVALCMLYFD